MELIGEILNLLPPERKVRTKPLVNINRTRRARIALHKVDLLLKDEGIDAAIKELQHIRKTAPLNETARGWIRDYLEMLKTWQNDVMPEVVDEFNEYGFRRAGSLIHRVISLRGRKLDIIAYRRCLEVFTQMSERSRRFIADIEDEMPPELRPKAEEECEGDLDDDVELDELDQEEIEQLERRC